MRMMLFTTRGKRSLKNKSKRVRRPPGCHSDGPVKLQITALLTQTKNFMAHQLCCLKMINYKHYTSFKKIILWDLTSTTNRLKN